jgi:ketosteroid isomerase-like protein
VLAPLLPTVLLVAATVSSAPAADALQSLVDAERAFARMSVEHGMKEAFLENLAVDGIVFQPLPVNGRKVWEPRSRPAATLIWEPAFAEVAAAGDLGYTTGPFELRPPADANQPILHGHFHSVWRRAPHGPWKVAVDIGGVHDPIQPGVGSGAFAAGPRHAAAGRGDRSRAASREILAAEIRFSRAAEKTGFAPAFAAVAAHDVRLGRAGDLPALGIVAARAAIAGDGAARWTAAGSGASRSGDLGYAYGVRERIHSGAAPDTSVFLHVWRREARGWKLALAVDNPVRR